MTASWVSVAAAMIALPAYATGNQAQDPPVAKFKSSVEVVSVSAVVKDRKGRFVSGLDARDFVVLEEGQERKILDFRAETDGPVKVGLLVDASGSMRVGRKAVDAEGAAHHLFSALRPGDEAALFSFDTRLDCVLDFTSDRQALQAGIEQLNPPYGQTSLYDAIGEAARLVAAEGRESAAGLPQRAALVVLTDGIDTRSRSTTEQVAAAASRIDVPVYIVAVMAGIDDPRVYGRPAFDVSGLEQMARGTGGEMFIATAPAHASLAARQIVDELRHQYVLAFEASARSGWRPVEIRARHEGLVVRARTGYSAGDSDRPAAAPTAVP